MPAKNSKTESDGFTAEERAAMKKRAAELRADGKKGAKKADGLRAAGAGSSASRSPGPALWSALLSGTVAVQRRRPGNWS